MIDALIQFGFMKRAMISGVLIGLLAPLIGVFIVVRRQSMIADALSHVTLAGISFSLLLGKFSAFFATLNPVFVGMAFSVIGALGIERLRNVYKHFQELAIPVIMSTGIGASVVFISLADGFNTDLFAFLFGSIMAIRPSDMWMIIVIGIIVVLTIMLFYKELFSLSFDEENARTTGLPRQGINLIFVVLVALVIASAMRIVGILLVSALMVLPVAASIKIANSFKQTFVYAILFGQISVIAGMWTSYVLDLAPGGTIVIFSFFILCVVLALKKWVLRTD